MWRPTHQNYVLFNVGMLVTNNLARSFQRFIRICGKQVTHLALNSVKFLSSDSLESVSMICEDLKGEQRWCLSLPDSNLVIKKMRFPLAQSYPCGMRQYDGLPAIHSVD